MFGAGFAVAFIGISYAALCFVFPAMTGTGWERTSEPEVVLFPPAITRTNRFLGSSGSYSGDFSHEGNRVLSPGPGRIVGISTVDGKPIAGLRLRLALNGNVMSRWAKTGADGRYEIRVPYGTYRIDGFELDIDTANSVLAGKIGHPQNPYSSDTFNVADDGPGQGLNFDFVDPVVLEIPKKSFTTDEDIVIRWQPYPGAKEYQVQIYESADPRGFGGIESVFSWRDIPVVNEPAINLSDYSVELKTGRYYTVSVEARASAWQPLSETPRQASRFDFEIVE